MLLIIIKYLIPIVIYGIIFWLTNRKKLEEKWNIYHRLSNMVSLAIFIITYITPISQLIGYTTALTILLVELIVLKKKEIG